MNVIPGTATTPAPTSPTSTTPLVFLDTETTGVHPARQIWEVAMIRRDEHGQRETQFFVDVALELADPFGLSIGRFYERHPLGAYLSGAGCTEKSLSRQQAASRVARWTHGAHIVGAVPNFDTEVLMKLVRSQSYLPAWHYHLVDVENLAVGYLAGQGTVVAPPWKSDDLTAAIGVQPATAEERHTALGDARWALRIYDRIMGGES